jgi:hypothetical protein
VPSARSCQLSAVSYQLRNPHGGAAPPRDRERRSKLRPTRPYTDSLTNISHRRTISQAATSAARAPVAQGIEHRFPNAITLPEVLTKNPVKTRVFRVLAPCRKTARNARLR